MKHTRILQFVLPVLFIFSSTLLSQDEPEKYWEVKKEYQSDWETGCSCLCDHCKAHHHEHADYNYRIKAISSRDFNDLANVVASKSFESTKIAVIKTAMEENYFNTDQVKSLLNMFSFESNKLELAKLAYSKTVDNSRYYKIYDVFSFESSINDLEDFIKNQ